MRIAISGTYSTGKTTTAIALSHLIGISCTHARTMREILPVTFPDKTLKECRFHELMELGINRFYDRVVAEKALGNSFISDGCSLQEWLYGTTRMLTGADPSENAWKMKWKRFLNPIEWAVFSETIAAFGEVIKVYAKTHYDVFFHLPVEFPFVADGHRPTSERFRNASEIRLIKVYDEIGINPIRISGTFENRLIAIMKHLNMEARMSIKEAIRLSVEERQKGFDAIPLESTSVG